MKIYLIGSLRNPEIPKFAEELRKHGFSVFDDWFSASAFADDAWRDYERARGHSYDQALNGLSAKHIFEFDAKHLAEADVAVMLMPAGKSGHLELGWVLGQGRPGFIVFDEEPERYDVMARFATGVFCSRQKLIERLESLRD